MVIAAAVRSLYFAVEHFPEVVLDMIRVQAQEETNVIIAKLGSWIRNADKNHDQFHSFDDAATVNHMLIHLKE